MALVIKTRQKQFSEEIRLGIYDSTYKCWLDWITFPAVQDISSLDKKIHEYKTLLIISGVFDNGEL